MRVLLITTGECERRGLPASLGRLFPEVEFEAIRRDGFTSRALPLNPVAGADSEVRKLAAELIASMEPGQRPDRRFDLALVLEDLELCNAAWPDRVAAHMRAAVVAHLREHPWPSSRSQERATERARRCCSFHLFSPMIEAYFFGEAAALQRAGATRRSRLDPGVCDVEDFLVQDAEYQDRVRFPDQSASQWASPDRERHPKHYLRFLCQSDPLEPERRSYRETKGGCAALERLDWQAVLARGTHTRLARSLLHDLADGLGVAAFEAGELHPETALKLGAPNAVLRNL